MREAATGSREAQFADLLHDPSLDGYTLKHQCLHGIPDVHRPEAWRCLLGVTQLHDKRSRSRKRKQYADLAAEILNACHKTPHDPRARRSPQDVWLDDIDKDVRRTQTSYAFFARRNPSGLFATHPSSVSATPHARCLFDRLDDMHPYRQQEIEERYPDDHHHRPPLPKGRAIGGSDADMTSGEDRHFECLIRLLYIYACLNPVHYVQGMSELVAPIYYVFAHDTTLTIDEASFAEADTFWAFSTLMSEFGDFFVQDSDGPMQSAPDQSEDTSAESSTGLGPTLRRFAKQLHWLDPELAYELHTARQVQPTFYALRWMTTLLAMEFPLPDLVRIWDTIFALLQDRAIESSSRIYNTAEDAQARGFLLDMGCAMVLHKRSQLLELGFSECLEVLQKYECDDISKMLRLAFSIRERRITGTLTGLDISSFASVPNSPVPTNEGFSSMSPIAAQIAASPSVQSARNLLSAAANSGAAKAFTNRFWRSLSRSETADGDVSISPTPNRIQLSKSSMASTTAAANDLLSKYALNLADSDTAAALSKATTNSYIAALQMKEAAPSTLSKIKSDVSAAVSNATGSAKSAIRPPSPTMDPPFTPPTSSNNHLLSPDSGHAGLGYGVPNGQHYHGERRHSGGPKPLLMSAAARRASNTSTPFTSPSASRRASFNGHATPPESGSLRIPAHAASQSMGPTPSIPLATNRMRTPSPVLSRRTHAHPSDGSVSTLGAYRFGGQVRHRADDSFGQINEYPSLVDDEHITRGPRSAAPRSAASNHRNSIVSPDSPSVSRKQSPSVRASASTTEDVEDTPLLPSSRLTRPGKPRTMSFNAKDPIKPSSDVDDVPSKESQPNVERTRRRLASSRRSYRQESVNTTGSRTSLDL